MDLSIYKPVDNAGLVQHEDLPMVYVAVVARPADPPAVSWANFRPLERFADLVNHPFDEGSKPTIILVPDEDALLAQVRLVCDNATVIGVQVIRVDGLTDHVISQVASTAFWGAKRIDWEDWKQTAEEDARIVEVVKRGALDSDERKIVDSRRKDGSIKAFAHDKHVGPAPAADEAEEIEDGASGLTF